MYASLTPEMIERIQKEIWMQQENETRLQNEQLRGQISVLLQHVSTTNLTASGHDSDEEWLYSLPEESFNVMIRRCGDGGGGKRARSDRRWAEGNSSGTVYWDTLRPITRKEAETTTLLDLCSMAKQERNIWLSAAAREGKEISLVVLRDGFDKDDRFVVPYHRLGEYTLDGLRRDGLISLRAGSKVCFQVEYLDKPDESGNCAPFPLPATSS